MDFDFPLLAPGNLAFERERERERGPGGVGAHSPGVSAYLEFGEGGEQAAEDGFALSKHMPERGETGPLPSAALVPANLVLMKPLPGGRPADSPPLLRGTWSLGKKGHTDTT